MGSLSKEDKVLELFLNDPDRHWHFEEILKSVKISRSKAAKWLNRFTVGKVIMRIKPKGVMPYYISYFDSPAYQELKRIKALERFYETGFLGHIKSLPKVKTAIIFGSFARADWYKSSDIDVFIYGEDDGFEKLAYERKLGHEIQLFVARNKKDLKNLGSALIRNIIKGYIIKGDINFVEVRVNAKA